MIKKLLADNPAFYKDSKLSDQKAAWNRVKVQAMGHIRNLDVDVIIDQIRPSESPLIKEYRNKNKRLLTKEGVDKLSTKVGRIFDYSGVSLEKSSITPNLMEWLESEPFLYLGQYAGLWEWCYRVMFPNAIEDPNSIIVAFPYSVQDKEVPPDYPESEGGQPPNQLVGVEIKLIESDKVVYFDDQVFGWEGGKMKLMRATGRSYKEAPYYFLCDDYEFGRYLPRLNEKDEITYYYERWYVHDSEMLPLNFMPGRLSKTEKGGLYYESFMQSYFEYADEFKASFSDNQAVRVLHFHPKVIMSELPCPEQGCSGGKIRVQSGEDIQYKVCGTCKGSGSIKDGGPFHSLIKRPNTGMEQGDTGEVYQYITPPTELLQKSYEITFDLLERAKEANGLDVLLDVTESGVAKNRRLEDLQDFLGEMAGLMFDTIEMMLSCVDSLLNTNKSERVDPKINRPKQFHLKDEIDLKEDYENALSFDRYNAAMSLIKHKYRDNEDLIRGYQIILRKYPVLLLSETELQLRLANGIYTNEDILRRDQIVQVMQEVIEENEIDNLTSERIIELIESNLDIFVAPPLFD